MATAVETHREPDQSIDRLSEFNARLYQVLGIEPDSLGMSIQALLLQETFESLEDILVKSRELAEKVSGAWQPADSDHHFRPDDDLMVQGLLDFGVYAAQILIEATSNMGAENVENIEEGILQVITRIRGAVETSDGRRHNLRTDRDRLRNSFTETLNRSSKTNP